MRGAERTPAKAEVAPELRAEPATPPTKNPAAAPSMTASSSPLIWATSSPEPRSGHFAAWNHTPHRIPAAVPKSIPANRRTVRRWNIGLDYRGRPSFLDYNDSMSAPASLPDLTTFFEVPEEAVEAYRRDGHVTLRGVCTPQEVEAYRAAIEKAVRRFNKEDRPLEQRDTYGKAFLQTMNLWEFDEAVARFTTSPRFAKIAADLMGVDGVRLYHDQALFKEPGGGPTPWHQDQFYWPLNCATTTMWMPLVRATTEMGTMKFASGSQNDGYISAIGISDESEAFFDRFVAERGYSVHPTGTLELGDVTFHAGWTLHAAGANRTEKAREAMTIIYFEDGAVLTQPDHENRKADLERWFPGQKPGETAGSKINPVLFRR
jgi:ectoine hydroxylase-related dioxygenase (phytanoyl-CoA dioxygenase family)